MLDHLPVLQVVVPLVMAPVTVLVRKRRVVFGLSVVTTWLTFFISIGLMVHVQARGAWDYALGGWTAPVGIVYHVDILSAYMLIIVSGIGAVVLSSAAHSVRYEIPRSKHYLFFCLYLLCLAGLLGICITGDLFNLFVFLEISSISTYALISLGKNRRALTAALQYLFAGSIGATFILISIGLMLQMTGALNMQNLADRLQTTEGTRTLIVAFAFFSVGVCLKMALFPLHTWLPSAYTYAPSIVSAFVAATATKVSVYIFLRVTLSLFKRSFVFDSLPFELGLMVLALVGIYVASIAAIFQSDVKRVLAFSSVAQIGYIVLGISLASVSGLTGAIVHLMNHALIKGGLFLATACVALRLGSTNIQDLRGLGRTMPWTMVAWAVGGFGLIGVPITAGFVTKWYLLTAAVEAHGWPLALLVLGSGLLALAYVWRIVELAFFGEPSDPAREATEAPLQMLIPVYLLIGASLYFGVFTNYSAGMAGRAAALLWGGGGL